jgi:hypothetical protein
MPKQDISLEGRVAAAGPELMPKQDMPLAGSAAVREVAPRRDMSSVGLDADAASARYSDEVVDHSDGSGVVGGGA